MVDNPSNKIDLTPSRSPMVEDSWHYSLRHWTLVYTIGYLGAFHLALHRRHCHDVADLECSRMLIGTGMRPLDIKSLLSTALSSLTH